MKQNQKFEEKLESIRKTLGVPVIFRVGMKKPGVYDLIDIQVFNEEDLKEEVEEVKLSYVG